MFIDYYEILEINWNCSNEEVKKAYRKQAIKWHPDKNPKTDTTRRMQLINEAFIILNDLEARERYNREYVLFKQFTTQKQKKPEYSKEEEHRNYQPYENDEYDIKDDILKNWIDNAKRQAVDLTKEIFELSKVGVNAAGKAIWTWLKFILILNLIIFVIYLIFKTCSNSAEHYNVSGKLKYDHGDKQGAIKDCNKAIEIQPQNAEAFYDRGMVKLDLEDYRGAIQDYNKAIEINPQDADAFCSRGLAKIKLEDYRGAVQDFDKALELNPQYSDAFCSRGLAKYKLEDYKGAIQNFDKAIELNPQYADAFCNRGNAKYQLGDEQDAIQDYNKAIEIQPQNASTFYVRGMVKLDLEDYRGAIQDYNRAIELNPQYEDAFNGRGLAKFKLDDKGGACLDWRKAGELGNKDAYDLIKKFCK